MGSSSELSAAPSARAPLVSVVVPCCDEEAVFPLLRDALEQLAGRLERAGLAVELLLVDDGSRDTTWERIAAFAAQDARVRGARLSRNFGHQLALTCGYDLAQGDAVVCLDADLQDPPEVIDSLVERWRAGADVVYAARERREGETRFKRGTAALFYRMIRALGATQVREDTGDFRLLSRRALEALRRMGEQHRFLRGMVGWIGFETAEVRYVRHARAAGHTKYPLRKMLRLAVDATVSFSSAPLRLTFVFAGLLSLCIFGYVGYSALRYLFFGAVLVPGWTSLLLAVMGFGALNLVCLGILGEYVGRIYEQSKQRPLYLVRGEIGPTRPEPAREAPAPEAEPAVAGPPRPTRVGNLEWR